MTIQNSCAYYIQIQTTRFSFCRLLVQYPCYVCTIEMCAEFFLTTCNLCCQNNVTHREIKQIPNKPTSLKKYAHKGVINAVSFTATGVLF